MENTLISQDFPHWDFPATLTPGWLSPRPSPTSSWMRGPLIEQCGSRETERNGTSRVTTSGVEDVAQPGVVFCRCWVFHWFDFRKFRPAGGGAIWKLRGKPPKSCAVSLFSLYILYFKYSIVQQTQNCMVNWGYQPTNITEGPFLSGVWTWSSLQFLELPLGSLKFLRGRFWFRLIQRINICMHHLGLGFRIV